MRENGGRRASLLRDDYGCPLDMEEGKGREEGGVLKNNFGGKLSEFLGFINEIFIGGIKS
jgi:hypothetical protein